MSEDIKEICRRARITDYLTQRGIQLLRLGRKSKCLCPLHQEKTPSFNITEMPDGREMFRCWGCDASGDVVDLIEQLEGKRKGDVIRELAQAVGMTLGKFNPGADRGKPNNDELLSLLCEEEEVCAMISEWGMGLMETNGGTPDIVDKVSLAYQMADDFVERGDYGKLDGILRQLKTYAKTYKRE